MLSPLNLWTTEIHHSLQEIHQTLHGPYPGNSHLDPENGYFFVTDLPRLMEGSGLSQASGLWTPTSLGGCRHNNKPRKDVEKLWKPGGFQKDINTYILIMLETLCGIFCGVPMGSHTSYKSSTECRYGMYGRWLQNESKYQYFWLRWIENEQPIRESCWLMVSPCFNPKKKTKSSGILIPSSLGFESQPAAPGTAWHPLPFFRGTAWQSHSGGPPACACALDMPPGPPKWCFV